MDQDLYKSFAKTQGPLSMDSKRRISSDLQSTQCKKALFYDQPIGYIKYIQTLYKKWSEFHHASADVDNIWANLLQELCSSQHQAPSSQLLYDLGINFRAIHLQFFNNEIIRHKYVWMIIKDCS